MVKNGASSHKTDYIEFFLDILHLEGHQNRCIGSKVMEILLNGWIWPTGGGEGSASAVCAASLFKERIHKYIFFFMKKCTFLTFSILGI